MKVAQDFEWCEPPNNHPRLATYAVKVPIFPQFLYGVPTLDSTSFPLIFFLVQGIEESTSV